jgi:hypothetical protein
MTQLLLASPPCRARRPRSVPGVVVPSGEVEAMLRELALVYRLTEQVKAALRTEMGTPSAAR